jgi:hypothetical protein
MSGDHRNFHVQATDTPERAPMVAFETPSPTRKNWKVLTTHPYGMPEETDRTPSRKMRFDLRRLAKAGAA